MIRKELRDRNIEHLKVVFSTEHPLEVKEKITNGHRISREAYHLYHPPEDLLLQLK